MEQEFLNCLVTAQTPEYKAEQGGANQDHKDH